MKSPILKLSLLTLSLISSSHFLFAQDTYHQNLQAKLANDFNLPNGEFILFDNETNLLNTAFNYGSSKQILDSEDTDFSKKVKLTIASQGANPWDAGWGISNQKRIEAGDKILLVYHIRVIDEEGRVNSYVERTSNFEKEAFYDLPVPSDWMKMYIPFEAKINYAPGDLNFGFHLAHQAQTIEIGGFTAINYKKNVSLDNLPQSVNNEEYGGFEVDAPWRASAAERIEQLRKADLNIIVKTSDGTPVEDAAIKVEMQEHEFAFGSAITAVRLAGNREQNNIYQGRILDLDGKGHGFNWAVFENDLKWPAWEENWFVNNNDAAKAVQWVEDQGIKLRGHTLVWPGLQNLPNDIGQNTNDTEYIKNRINEHLEDILTYPGIQGNVEEWDVLNEIVSNRSLQNIFAREEEYETGRELYVEIFDKVKQIDPNTGLWLNDFATITLNNTGGGGYDSLKLYISELLDAGVPLDGIGFQGHIGGFPNSIYDVLGTLDDFYNTFGLPAKITEFDMPKEMSEELA
ncbi:MAG: endo-1,4-beta-xylanase, partial [Bacteroidota bacterium]